MKSFNRRSFIKTTALAGAGIGFFNSAKAFDVSTFSASDKRIGIIGLDTSHSEVFTKLINNGGPEMAGYKVVAAYAQGSKDIPQALKAKPGITAAVKGMGVELVDSIEELIRKVDVVLLETVDGRPHYEQALPVMQAGKRMFIDKPIAATLEDAKKIYAASKKYNAPIFSSSALRYDTNVMKVTGGSIGKVLGADVYTPGEIEPNHMDMAWYAIHGIEMLFTVMGPGCKTVTRIHKDGADFITGVWNDGRIGSVRAIRKGAANIAGTAFGEKGIAPLGPFNSYAPLIGEIISFFETGKPPVSEAETMEIFTFIRAADMSRKRNGASIAMASV
ncbi:Gfo/Idh/MocA family oxidoreductase [Pedobacter sp. ASV1-7]|jgi:predicted dehydrogenase|uniref:Gfo/Idh/MocA family protein n=1 Tax=Pedobacter sp. ASV1-7 TaxID=3145237 RepID=UPI0032E8621D